MFISFEGLDGCGKTTQAAMLADALEAEGERIVRVREPGGTPAGERIRSLLLDPGESISPVAEALLYAAARAQLVADVIRPALRDGAHVVADRFVDSTLAYQGIARGLGVDEVLEVNRFATGGLFPDRTLLLRLDGGEAARRRDAEPDRIEAEGESFQAAVARGFEELAARFPERIVEVDASGPPDQVLERVRRAAGV
jgi:dTMP kinase